MFFFEKKDKRLGFMSLLQFEKKTVGVVVVEEGPVTPVLCGGMPLTFGGIH